MRRNIFRFIPALLAMTGGRAGGQTLARDNYYHHLPPMPRLVSQTAASARLHLYGDASAATYRDDSPRDGIDDARGRQLHRIAVRFSPILRYGLQFEYSGLVHRLGTSAPDTKGSFGNVTRKEMAVGLVMSW